MRPPGVPARLVLLSRPGCHLCDDARQVVERVAGERGIGWTEVDVTKAGDTELLDAYGDRLPVLLLDGAEHAYWRVEPERLRAALDGRRVW